jgi:large subunit ribosomal protein L21
MKGPIVYAVIEHKGSQLVVREGDVVRLPYDADLEPGKSFKADRVLLIGGDKKAKVGRPEVSGASVSFEVLDHGRARKVLVYKKKRRKDYRRKTGHRQHFTEAVVSKIAAS